MESILLIYKSKTGFTKKYVDWITEAITCRVIPLDEMNNADMNTYDIIIYGAGIHAGRIQGLKEFKMKVLSLVSKKIVVFVTGGAPYSEEIFTNIKMNNYSPDELNRFKLFYFQSGLNYEKMGLSDKAMMKIYHKILELKKNRSDIEDGTNKAISGSYDHSSREYIEPLITYLKQLLIKS
ncbi:flavodoxin domain-containing protein [Alkaliphilus serpentinus]|uniref:Flavodoxin-like domain-containing protein n=1 Tax=Alkaliphilus serpentinus TaxID=1482731 RepID=A0A833HLK4_9FIRM|nr:flavodoxin domain-containing protein [Alkaliphilus serpentinus]KAB3525897.1 hypothetical protein F8153_14275 [Alkaliphilus serpentinus]